MIQSIVYLIHLVHIDGGYTTWTAWSTCSVTCGSSDAVHARSRSCTNPRPLNNGLNCTQQGLGGTVEVQPCGRSQCPGMAIYNRVELSARFDIL